MKRRYLLVLVILLGLSYNSYAQDFSEVRDYFNELEKQINTAKDDPLLMSYPSLNIFLAKKVNTYLTGSSDLAVNQSYFIVEPSNGRLFLGYNWAKDPSKTKKRTRFVLTTGIEADVSDDFSTIYSGGDTQLSSNLGGVLKLTWLGRGVIKYDDGKTQIQQKKKLMEYGLESDEESSYSQQEIAYFYRKQIQNEIESSIKDEHSQFLTRMQDLDQPAYRALQKKQFYENMNKKYKQEYITREANSVANNGYYNSYWDHWVSLKLYLPFTRQSHEVAPDFASSISTYKLYNLDGSLTYNHLREWKEVRFLGSFGIGTQITNNLKTTLQEYTIGDFIELSNPNNITLAEIESNDIYVGEYDEYLNSYVKFQAVGFFIAKKRIGLSFQAEKYFNTYNPLNVKIGIPFTLTGEDENTKASFELQFRLNDLNNDINPDKTWSEKSAVGISVGVPLTSKFY